MDFRLVPKSVTLNDPERRNGHLYSDCTHDTHCPRKVTDVLRQVWKGNAFVLRRHVFLSTHIVLAGIYL